MNKKVRDVEWTKAKYRLKQISQVNLHEIGFSCYVASMGGLSKGDLKSIEKKRDFKFIRIDKFNSKSFLQKAVPFFLSSYWGVAEINCILKIEDILDDMTNQVMAELYIFNDKHKEEFNRNISTINNPLEISDFVEQYSDFFMYQLDADNMESKTGMVEIISFGKDCPKILKKISELSFFK